MAQTDARGAGLLWERINKDDKETLLTKNPVCLRVGHRGGFNLGRKGRLGNSDETGGKGVMAWGGRECAEEK